MSDHLPVSHVAVVGGGVAGYAAAVLFRQRQVHVDLFETTSSQAVGSGIMLQANALRVLRAAGVLDAVQAQGYGFDSTGIRLPDATGRLVAELTDGRIDPTLPAAVGISRARLADLLRGRAEQVGVSVRLGTTATAVRSRGHAVDIDTVAADGADGVQTSSYDLLVGADGLNSTVRAMIGIHVGPRLLPLGVWRVVTQRPATVTRTEIITGGAAYFAGYAPISKDLMYAWLVDDFTDRRHLNPAHQINTVRGLAASYHGPWDDIRAQLSADTPINYTRYSELLVPPPWHRGRVVLIGDAAHACPPTMAQGAAQALEDAAVLADMTTGAAAVDDDLLTAFAARRLPRVRAVVEGSVQMATWQLNHERGDVVALMSRTSRMLAEPA